MKYCFFLFKFDSFFCRKHVCHYDNMARSNFEWNTVNTLCSVNQTGPELLMAWSIQFSFYFCNSSRPLTLKSSIDTIHVPFELWMMPFMQTYSYSTSSYNLVSCVAVVCWKRHTVHYFTTCCTFVKVDWVWNQISKSTIFWPSRYY